ncbi:hypothetical protein SDC9_199635 [bioreactor metagenome]|uniref:Uncharacterized protein n=1 Tax=bioreactor metagenome TaxID=1076179 RepID=A0A645IXQ1_9ZZZZ
MFVAKGQGLIAVIRPSRNAVSKGQLEPSVRLCKKLIIIQEYFLLYKSLRSTSFFSNSLTPSGLANAFCVISI